MCRKFEKSNVSYCNVAPTNFYCASAALTKNAVYFGSVVFSPFLLLSPIFLFPYLFYDTNRNPYIFPTLSLSVVSGFPVCVSFLSLYPIRSPHTKDISSLPFFPCILHSKVS